MLIVSINSVISIEESDSTNNINFVRKYIADLVISQINLNSSSFTVEDTVGVSAIMKNIGTLRSKAPSEFFFIVTYPSGATKNAYHIINKGLKINETINSGNISFFADKSGNYQITYIADPHNYVREGNESNNNNSITIKVSEERIIAKPDLTVLKPIKITPQQPNISDIVELNAIIKNIGNATTGKVPIGVKWQTVTPSQKLINDTYGVITIGGLDVGENLTVMTKILVEDLGEYHTNITVDYLNTINESNESNNYREFVFNVGPINETVPTIDLIISDMKVPDYLFKGQNFTIFASVKNIGNAVASFNGVWKLWKADFEGSIMLFEGFTNQVIAPNQVIPFTLNYSYSKAGNYTFKISADPENVIRERINETNNNVSIKLVVVNESAGGGGGGGNKSLPDLVIKDVRIIPINPVVEGNLTLNFSIKNQGNGRVNSSVFPPITLSANVTKPSGLVYFLRLSIPPDVVLEALDVYYLLIPMAPFPYTYMVNESGNYSLIAYVDSSNIINESNENNNLFNYSFYIAPYFSNISGADIIIKDVFIYIFHDIGNDTDSVEIYGNVKNIGSEDASPPSPINWAYLETDFGDSTPPYIAETSKSILPGESIPFKITHNYGHSSGQFVITLKADPFDIIDEDNEDNNRYSIKILI